MLTSRHPGVWTCCHDAGLSSLKADKLQVNKFDGCSLSGCLKSAAATSCTCSAAVHGCGDLADLTLMEIQKHIQSYLKHLETRGMSVNTIETQKYHLGKFLSFLLEKDINEVREISRHVINAYQGWLRKQQYKRKPGTLLSPGTVYTCYITTTSFIRYLTDTGILIFSPLPANITIPVKKPFRVIPSPAEIMKVMNICNLETPRGLRDRAIMEFLYSTGLRVSELCNLDLPDIDPVNRDVRVQKGKGGYGRIVPIGKKALKYLDHYLKKVRSVATLKSESSALFITLNGQKKARLSPVTTGIYIKNYGRTAGLKLTPHVFRHAMSVHMLQNGADIRYIQAILGHASIQTTERYLHLSYEEICKVHRKTHPMEVENDTD